MKIIASKGKVLYCKELNRYATATTDNEHEWVEVEKEENKEVKENGEQ